MKQFSIELELVCESASERGPGSINASPGFMSPVGMLGQSHSHGSQCLRRAPEERLKPSDSALRTASCLRPVLGARGIHSQAAPRKPLGMSWHVLLAGLPPNSYQWPISHFPTPLGSELQSTCTVQHVT